MVMLNVQVNEMKRAAGYAFKLFKQLYENRPGQCMFMCFRFQTSIRINLMVFSDKTVDSEKCTDIEKMQWMVYYHLTLFSV